MAFPSTGLVSYWKLDETSGTTTIDNTGANNGTITGATVNETGKISKAYTFANSNYIEIANESNFDFLSNLTASFTISLWIKTTTTSSGRILTKSLSAAQGRGLDINFNYNTLAVICDFNETNLKKRTYSASDWDTGAPNYTPYYLNDGDWHHLVIVGSGDVNADAAVTFYLDGRTTSSTGLSKNGTVASITSDYPVRIGAPINSASGGIIATIDEIGVWNTTLSSSDVASLYNSGNGLTYPNSTSIPNALTISSTLNDPTIPGSTNITINPSTQTLTSSLKSTAQTFDYKYGVTTLSLTSNLSDPRKLFDYKYISTAQNLTSSLKAPVSGQQINSTYTATKLELLFDMSRPKTYPELMHLPNVKDYLNQRYFL